MQISSLIEKINKARSYQEKKMLIWQTKQCQVFFSHHPALFSYLENLNDKNAYLLSSLIALNQGELFFKNYPHIPSFDQSIQKLLSLLDDVENFYSSIGGVLGYHKTFLHLLKNEGLQKASIHKPHFIDCQTRSNLVDACIDTGLENLDKTAFIFPIGGSSDRFNLQDPKTKENLPLAFYNFAGKNLLEHLVEQTQALESLYFQTYQKSISCPIVLMTSEAKGNREKIEHFLKEKNYFGRKKESFCVCHQISVPMISEKGTWILEGPLSVSVKPGGHGALWKTMLDQNAFDFLFSQNCKHGIVRQINNPIAGLDYGLLSLLGYGIKHEKKFGFSTCNRPVGSASGMLVLKEIKKSQGMKGFFYSNIEYSDFQKWYIEDKPLEKGGKDSEYPANTNTLFIDLKEIYSLVQKDPLPGIILNIKSSIPGINAEGEKIIERAGRIELCMQNIADDLITYLDKTSPTEEQLKSFLIYQNNQKALSPIKKPYTPEKSWEETQVKCFYDLMALYAHILQKSHVEISSIPSCEEWINNGPSYLIFLSPFLGPLFSLIEKKFYKGHYEKGFFLDVQIQNCQLFNLHLQGALVIQGTHPLSCGCSLENVKIFNQGSSWNKNFAYIQKESTFKEALRIDLNQNSQFVAHDILIEGSHHFKVPANQRMTLKTVNNKLISQLEPL
jgi:hypothetical protein